jgi:hypothetical protein
MTGALVEELHIILMTTLVTSVSMVTMLAIDSNR